MSKTIKSNEILPIVHAEAPAEEPEIQGEEAAPEPEEPEDVKPKIEAECGETPKCKSLRAHLDECTHRVESGETEENCNEELYHFMHCVDHCAAPKIFAHLK
ncbi:10965_t:CDS:2 [Ambispora gerdemannii]|uniref:10965_t:CDS:1 n=1 Tax=Ambispora gerdemannii TaxID=144530 RepID=A0A9N9FTP6_9GLOM|nr:10965_t:CDS:2 [Ambispora gerdemannii]